jgi:hypothetical protein
MLENLQRQTHAHQIAVLIATNQQHAKVNTAMSKNASHSVDLI